MKHFLLAFFFITYHYSGFSQDLSKETNLNDAISETSGLIYVDDRLITHNDSGGLNALFEIDVNDGTVSRTVTIENAVNRDWEDICHDEGYIYIGDFGNNNGNRTDLRIYKVKKTDYLGGNSVNAELIEFSYQDQNDFTSSPNNTNFDAEALISFGDDLYVFTKNWVDQRSNIYKVSKTPGEYVAERIDEFDAKGLITGGTYNTQAKKIILTGYAGISAFATELRGFSNGKFSNGVIDKYNLSIPFTESFQVEAIAYVDVANHYISAEKNALGSAALYTLVSNTLGVDDINLVQHQVYPNPAVETLSISGQLELDRIEIYDYLGKKVYEGPDSKRSIDISGFSKGVYILKLYSSKRSRSIKFLKE